MGLLWGSQGLGVKLCCTCENIQSHEALHLQSNPTRGVKGAVQLIASADHLRYLVLSDQHTLLGVPHLTYGRQQGMIKSKHGALYPNSAIMLA